MIELLFALDCSMNSRIIDFGWAPAYRKIAQPSHILITFVVRLESVADEGDVGAAITGWAELSTGCQLQSLARLWTSHIGCCA